MIRPLTLYRDDSNLTVAQAAALKHSEYGSTGDAHYCDPDLYCGPTKATLKALVRKGYLDDAAAPFRYWLTEKGETARTRLLHETCAACGAETHRNESACVACGKLKPWVDNYADPDSHDCGTQP